MHRIIEFESRISPQTLCHPVRHTHSLIHSFTQRTFMVHSNLSVLHAVGKRNYIKRWKARHTVRLTDLVWRQASVPPHVPISLLSIFPLDLPGPVILTPQSSSRVYAMVSLHRFPFNSAVIVPPPWKEVPGTLWNRQEFHWSSSLTSNVVRTGMTDSLSSHVMLQDAWACLRGSTV